MSSHIDTTFAQLVLPLLALAKESNFALESEFKNRHRHHQLLLSSSSLTFATGAISSSVALQASQGRPYKI